MNLVRGVCGDFDGNVTNDLVLWNGENLDSTPWLFGNYFIVADDPENTDYLYVFIAIFNNHC